MVTRKPGSQYTNRTWTAVRNHRDWSDHLRLIFGDAVQQCEHCLDAPEILPAGGAYAYTSSVTGERVTSDLVTARRGY
jgi:hypothetical protein